MREGVEANAKRLEAIERQLAQTTTTKTTTTLPPEITPTRPFVDGRDASFNAGLADLQRQLDNVTQIAFVDFQRRVELAFVDVKNDLKRLEEKTSRWLQDSSAEHLERIGKLGGYVDRLAQAQQGRYAFYYLADMRTVHYIYLI